MTVRTRTGDTDPEFWEADEGLAERFAVMTNSGRGLGPQVLTFQEKDPNGDLGDKKLCIISEE
jgi:hypothetical protein